MLKNRKALTIILNLTDKCNLSCKYCFEGQFIEESYEKVGSISQDFMSAIPDFVRLAKEVYEYNNRTQVRILLHGGEPFLVSPVVMQLFFEEIGKLDINPYYMLQTNGTLVDEKYIKILTDNNVHIGVSIDGYKELHNNQRVDKGNRGTFDKVLKGISTMGEAGIAPGGMATITAETIKNPEAFYQFYSQNNMDLRFNPIFRGEFPAKDDSVYINPEEYAEFCCRIFDLWINDVDGKIDIHNFTMLIKAFFDKEKAIPTCTFNKNCFDSFVTINTKGDLYHCHRMEGVDTLCSGNIKSISLEDFIGTGEFMEERWSILVEDDCKQCGNFELCYGGCPYNAYLYKGSFFEKDYFCHAYKIINNYIYQYLKTHEK